MTLSLTLAGVTDGIDVDGSLLVGPLDSVAWPSVAIEG